MTPVIWHAGLPGNRVSICRLKLFRLLILCFVSLGVCPSVQAETRTVLALDETCSVNILNRTVQANEQGRFALANVPSFMGQVRARATCLKDGVTVSGQTDYFSVVTNDVVDVGEFFVADAEPLPTKLEIVNAPPITVRDLASQFQLIVRAHYADQSIVDVSGATPGINYQSTNPAVACEADLVSLVSRGASYS